MLHYEIHVTTILFRGSEQDQSLTITVGWGLAGALMCTCNRTCIFGVIYTSWRFLLHAVVWHHWGGTPPSQSRLGIGGRMGVVSMLILHSARSPERQQPSCTGQAKGVSSTFLPRRRQPLSQQQSARNRNPRQWSTGNWNYQLTHPQVLLCPQQLLLQLWNKTRHRKEEVREGKKHDHTLLVIPHPNQHEWTDPLRLYREGSLEQQMQKCMW